MSMIKINGLVELNDLENSKINGGWINPVAAYMAAVILAYEIGKAVGEGIYNVAH